MGFLSGTLTGRYLVDFRFFSMMCEDIRRFTMFWRESFTLFGGATDNFYIGPHKNIQSRKVIQSGSMVQLNYSKTSL